MTQKTLSNIWNQVPVNYYQTGIRKNIFQRIWHGRKISLAKQIIKGLNFSSCLDVGCASGYMISQIAQSNPDAQYFGVDVYGKAIQYAKKIYPDIFFKTASAQKLPFKGNSFDLLVCYETIEHVQDPILTLKEMKRVLKKDGTLILAMDSGSSLFRLVWSIWKKTYGRAWRNSHLHPFKHDELDQIILESGFKVKNKLFSHLGMEVVYILSK